MMKLIQHIPALFDMDYKPEQYDIYSKEELLNNEWVKRFLNSGGRNVFYRLSISRPCVGDKLLMAEYNEGYKWWVIGYLKGDSKEILRDFPEWEGKFKDINDIDENEVNTI